MDGIHVCFVPQFTSSIRVLQFNVKAAQKKKQLHGHLYPVVVYKIVLKTEYL